MNKKLLLSFAVFATALSVNAQKRGASNFSKNLKPSRNTTLVVQDYDSKLDEFDYSKNVFVNSFDSKVLGNPSKKRALETHVDTSLFFDVSRRYLSPRNSSFTIYPYVSEKKDSIEMTALGQTIPNVSKSKFTLNGLFLVVGSRNKIKGSTDVVVKIYDDNGKVLATAAQNLKYVAPTSSNPTPLSFVPFVFDKPFVSNEDITFFIESKTAKDTIAVYTSGAYRNASISCNIKGNSLTLVSPAPTSPANLGTSFWYGQEISGNGIPAGTKITAISQTTPTVYTLSNSVTSDLNNVVVVGKNLKFADYSNTGFTFYPKFPILSSGEPDLTKDPKVSVESIHAINGVPFDAHIICYPMVSYSFDNKFVSTNKCLGDNNEVSVNESVDNPFLSIAKNPILNKMSFYSLLDSKAYYHGAAYTKSKSLSDTMFQSRKDFKVTYKANDVTKNDTLIVSSLFWKYGFNKPISQPNQFSNSFLLSSKISSTVNVTDAKCFGEKASVEVKATGGIGVLTGTGVKEFDAVAGTQKIEVADVNGCKVSVDAIIKAAPTKVEASSIVTDAKCIGEKVKVEVKANGGTGAITGSGVFYEDAVNTTKTYDVLDANNCKGSTTAQIKAVSGNATAPVVSVTVTDAKCFGDMASVDVKATGTGTLTGTGLITVPAVAGTKSFEVKDGNGCVGVGQAQIKAAPAKVEVTATVTDVKCFGDSAAVEVKATGGTGALIGVGIKKFTATAATSTQKIEVLDANKCKATVDATIKAAPAALVVTTKTTDATNNKTTDGTAEATVVGGTSPYTYAWDEKSTTAKITKTAGTFKVTVTDANGCKKEATAIIADKKVSITELGLTNVLVYPNPVINTLNVKFDASTIATVELVNVAGQVLNSEVSSDVTFNTSNLASGVYFVNIKVEEGVYTQKIIKE